jgi:hypothetical protein
MPSWEEENLEWVSLVTGIQTDQLIGGNCFSPIRGDFRGTNGHCGGQMVRRTNCIRYIKDH